MKKLIGNVIFTQLFRKKPINLGTNEKLSKIAGFTPLRIIYLFNNFFSVLRNKTGFSEIGSLYMFNLNKEELRRLTGRKNGDATSITAAQQLIDFDEYGIFVTKTMWGLVANEYLNENKGLRIHILKA